MPPRPRPRPRPVDKAAIPSSPIPTPSESSRASSKKSAVEDDDDDSFFIHNKGRSLREVEERAAKVAAMTASNTVEELSSDEGESDNTTSEDGTPRPRPRSKKNAAGKKTGASGWINQDTVAELLRQPERNVDTALDLSDEEGEQAGPSQLHSKRPRSRSRSLTPPPVLTEQERLRTQMAIRRVLEGETVAPVIHAPPANLIEDDDIMEPGEEPIDPSLRHIIEKVGNRNLNRSSLGPEQTSTSFVTIRVKWIYPPGVHRPAQKQWAYNIRKTDSLRQIAENISKEMGVIPKELRLLHNGKHVYTTISPQGLGIWDEFDLDACLMSTYETMDTRLSTPPPHKHGNDDVGSERADSPTSETSADDSNEKFKLIVRAENLSLPLSVRPTTTCGKIVKAFVTIMVKEKGLTVPPKKASLARLYVDGEKQDPNAPISDCDLEDGDMVEIIGL